MHINHSPFYTLARLSHYSLGFTTGETAQLDHVSSFFVFYFNFYVATRFNLCCFVKYMDFFLEFNFAVFMELCLLQVED